MTPRNSAGISAEDLSLQEAYFEGARAGSAGRSPSLNPYQDFTPEHREWERGRMVALGQSLTRRVA